MADELIRMDHISKSYGSVQALTDVTLTVGESEIVGLLGDNGAGKSTLIKNSLRRNPADQRRDPCPRPQGQFQDHDRCHRRGHRDDLPGFRAGDAAVDRPQPVRVGSRSRDRAS